MSERTNDYHIDLPRVLDDIKELQKGHTLLEASIKSVHKRMDEEKDVRRETFDKVSNIETTFKNYVESEKKQLAQAARIRNLMIIVAIPVAGWIFTTIDSNQNLAALNTQSNQKLEKSIDNIDEKLDDIVQNVYMMKGAK